MTPRKPAPTRRPRDTADGIPVWCAFDKLVDPATLRGDPENYNGHPPEQLRMIAASVKAQGWQKPIVVDIRTGLTVTGHGETAAAVQAGLKLVPVDFRWYATDADRQQWLIADNRFASLAEVQAGALKDLLQKLDDGSRDMDATGYDAMERELLATCDTPMHPVDVQKPPSMAWVLIGVPIGEWGKVAPAAEAAALIQGAIVETTINDGIKEN
jgi:hypothetical protein